jgi:hypothetical protein
MNKTELIKILENGLLAIRNAETDMALAKVLDTVGGICKYESVKIQHQTNDRLFKTRLDTLAD